MVKGGNDNPCVWCVADRSQANISYGSFHSDVWRMCTGSACPPRKTEIGPIHPLGNRSRRWNMGVEAYRAISTDLRYRKISLDNSPFCDILDAGSALLRPCYPLYPYRTVALIGQCQLLKIIKDSFHFRCWRQGRVEMSPRRGA